VRGRRKRRRKRSRNGMSKKKRRKRRRRKRRRKRRRRKSRWSRNMKRKTVCLVHACMHIHIHVATQSLDVAAMVREVDFKSNGLSSYSSADPATG